MNIDTILAALDADRTRIEALQRYIASHHEAFELLDEARFYQMGDSYTLFCHPPYGCGAAFALLLGHPYWRKAESSIGAGEYLDWIGQPEGCAVSLHVFAAELRQPEEKEVRL